MDLVYERRGDGPPLVLLHGIGHRWQAWEPVIDRLAVRRDVIACDLPGFGRSPTLPAGVPRTVDTLADAVADFCYRLGVERPHVAGNSLGGLLALELAKRGRARSVTALSPAGFYTRAEFTYAASVLRGSRLAASRVPPAWMRRLAGSPVMRSLMFGMIYGRPSQLSSESLVGDALALRDASAFDETLYAGVGGAFEAGSVGISDTPVTIAWGTRDLVLLRRQGARAKQAIPHADMVSLPSCGHVPMGDAPELVAAEIIATSART